MSAASPSASASSCPNATLNETSDELSDEQLLLMEVVKATQQLGEDQFLSLSIPVSLNVPVEECWSIVGDFGDVRLFNPPAKGLSPRAEVTETHSGSLVRKYQQLCPTAPSGFALTTERLLARREETHTISFVIEEEDLKMKGDEFVSMTVQKGDDENSCVFYYWGTHAKYSEEVVQFVKAWIPIRLRQLVSRE